MKKKLVVAAAAGAMCVAATTAFALENEFHGMYKAMGYSSNFFNGYTLAPAQTSTLLRKDAGVSNFFEQRARLMYIAKANDNLKLVTHFELDSRFGGVAGGYKGITTGNDSGNLDADQLTLETKNVYLDTNCPITGANIKIGIQPWADSYQSLFLLADMTGLYVTKKFDPLTASFGWFRYADLDTNTNWAGDASNDLFVVDAKYAINKDMTVGASLYAIDNGTNTLPSNVKDMYMPGVNASLTFGPATINPFVAVQFGRTTGNQNLNGFLGGATAKVKNVGPGNINAAFVYMSGDDRATSSTSYGKAFKPVSANTSYFNAANMWLLVRSGQAVNSSTSVTGNDLTVGGRGLVGIFAGYEGTRDKAFYNANVGYAMTAEQRKNGTTEESSSLGTELNATVGYKLYDNLAVSLTGAYAILGDALKKSAASNGKGISGFATTVADADNPWLANLQLSYTF
ncbi:MAG: porin [Geobacter sp.]|nr:porin [Geobacter sp.]